MNYKYLDGRFFISPLIGCQSNCMYCYLKDELDNPHIIRKNQYSIGELLKSISEDKRFKSGKTGSIISIGAYCDIFPLNNIDFVDFSIDWIINSLKLQNPVQIISKNTLSKERIKLICSAIEYPEQLLYSTTITSFKHWHTIEKNTSSPYERLNTLKLFKSFGIHTNVMIKPFLPNITSLDFDAFLKFLNPDVVDFCVVGDLYSSDDKIIEILSVITKSSTTDVDVLENQILDCTENKAFQTISNPQQVQSFINRLISNDIKVFKKSSCVNSNILKTSNISAYYHNSSNNYCLNCGNCYSRDN